MKSDIKYINWNNQNKKWVVTVTINKERRYLGSFDDIAEAKLTLSRNGIPIIPKSGNSKHYIESDYFKVIDSPRKAFWFGFICADGSIYKLGHSISLKISQSNNILLNQFVEDVKSSKGVYKESNSDKYYFNTYDRAFVNNLINNGKTFLKSELNEIPKSIRDELKKYFIRGYFEGDGSIYLSNGSLGFQISAYDGMAKDIALCIGLGIGDRVGVYKDKSISSIQTVGNNKVKTIMSHLYGDVEANKCRDYPKLSKYIDLLGEI